MRNNKCLLLHNKNTPVLSSSSSRTGPRQRIDANLVDILFELTFMRNRTTLEYEIRMTTLKEYYRPTRSNNKRGRERAYFFKSVLLCVVERARAPPSSSGNDDRNAIYNKRRGERAPSAHQSQSRVGARVRVFFSDVCVVSITRNDRRWFVHSFFFFANSKNVTIAATAAMFEITIFVVVVPPPTHTGIYSGGDRMGGK